MASIGGNLMQRPRCLYFRDVSAACNRRTPGAGCSAIGGLNRTHAILGTSEQCVATHPSDLAVALVALDATVHHAGPPRASSSIPIAQFFRQPGSTPDQRAHDLRPGELIVAVEVPSRARDAPVGLPEGARPAVVRIRAGVGRGGAGHRRRARCARPRRRRRGGDRTVAAARGRAAPCSAGPRSPVCGDRRLARR